METPACAATSVIVVMIAFGFNYIYIIGAIHQLSSKTICFYAIDFVSNKTIGGQKLSLVAIWY